MNEEQIKQLQKTGDATIRDKAIWDEIKKGNDVYLYYDFEDYKVRFSPKERKFFVKLGTRNEFESDMEKNNILFTTFSMWVYPITKAEYEDGTNLKKLAEEAKANYKIWETQDIKK